MQSKKVNGASNRTTKSQTTPPTAHTVPAKHVKVYYRGGKRVAAHVRVAKEPELNQFTGKPRQWKYYGPKRRVNTLLALAEAERDFPLDGFASRPLDVCRAMVLELERLAGGLKRAIETKEYKTKQATLTEAEIRYCEAEGIPPADFLARKLQRL